MLSTQLEQLAVSLHEERLRQAAHDRLVRDARRAGRIPAGAPGRGLTALGRVMLACARLPARLAGAASSPLRRKRVLAASPAANTVARRTRARIAPVRVAAA